MRERIEAWTYGRERDHSPLWMKWWAY